MLCSRLLKTRATGMIPLLTTKAPPQGAAKCSAPCCSDRRRQTVLHRGPGCRRAVPDATHPQHHHHIGVAQSPGGLDQACPAPLRVLEVLADALALVPDVPGAGSQTGNLAGEVVCGDSRAAIVAGLAAGVVGGGAFVSAGAKVVPELTTRNRRRLAIGAAVVPGAAGAQIVSRRRRRVRHCGAAAGTAWPAERRAQGIGCGAAAASSKATAAATSSAGANGLKKTLVFTCAF